MCLVGVVAVASVASLLVHLEHFCQYLAHIFRHGENWLLLILSYVLFPPFPLPQIYQIYHNHINQGFVAYHLYPTD